MIPDQRLKELINWAIEIASEVENQYRIPTFQVILRKAIEEQTPELLRKVSSEKQPSRGDLDSPSGEIQSILNSTFDWGSIPVPKLTPSNQNLALIRIALHEFHIDGLSPKDIQKILFQKYRLSKTPNAVSMLLKNSVGKHVDRIQKGKEFVYRITDPGIKVLEKSLAEANNG